MAQKIIVKGPPRWMIAGWTKWKDKALKESRVTELSGQENTLTPVVERPEWGSDAS